jgi:3-oxoacyl-[acyl-carrier-protein] synthase-3
MPNSSFKNNTFYNTDHSRNPKESTEILDKLTEISGIVERRYVNDKFNTSDIAFFAADDALKSSGIDGESLDYIIVAHNFADVRSDNHYSDMLPNVAAKVKQKLGIMHMTYFLDVRVGYKALFRQIITFRVAMPSGLWLWAQM